MRNRALIRRFRGLIVAGAIVFLVSFSAHSLHADSGVCSACSCDTNYFSPEYHGTVCNPSQLFPHHCFATNGHHCDNYPDAVESPFGVLLGSVFRS